MGYPALIEAPPPTGGTAVPASRAVRMRVLHPLRNAVVLLSSVCLIVVG
jgi:hypothetical protein